MSIPKATHQMQLQADQPTEVSAAHSGAAWHGRFRGLTWEVHCGDALEVLKTFPPDRFACVVTSPPYYSQRDYGVDGQIGLESTIDAYIQAILATMEEVRRVLRPDGLLFLNLGDTYYSGKGMPRGPDRKNVARRFGLRPVDASGLGVARKTIIGIPWRVAIEMIDFGWVLRSPIVWQRNGSLPEPTARDRPWRTYEMIFMFSKEPRYHFDRTALNGTEDVWQVSARPSGTRGIHYAAFPDELVERCLRIGCAEAGEVLDPFAGSGTVLSVALSLGHPAVGIDLSDTFCDHIITELSAL